MVLEKQQINAIQYFILYILLLLHSITIRADPCTFVGLSENQYQANLHTNIHTRKVFVSKISSLALPCVLFLSKICLHSRRMHFPENVRNYIVPSTSNTSFPLVLLDPGSVSLSMAARTRISVEEISVSGKVTASKIA